MPAIHFQPDNVTGTVAPGTTILEAARLLGVTIEAPCNGAGHCGKCAVLVAPPEAIRYSASSAGISPDVVLACHAEITDDLTVQVGRIREERLKIVAAGATGETDLLPRFTKRYSPEEDVTFIAADDRTVGVEPGNTATTHFGAVVDIGTTTLVVGIVDLGTGAEVASRSALNPQALHGQDVLSRITIASDPAGLEMLRSVLLTELNRLVSGAAGDAGVAVSSVYEVIFSGNTCMLHLATGADPSSLGRLPFTPLIRGGTSLSAAECGIDLAPCGQVWLPPVISAYVGADITAGIVAARLTETPGTSLFIDIGTNGEMVLSHLGHLVATATAAGPAFEGMNISCGMRASAGAIEAVSVDDTSGDLSLSVIGDGPPAGICGSGLVDLVAELVRTGVIGPTGRLCVPDAAPLHRSLRDRLTEAGGKRSFHLAEGVQLTQGDVRQVQLAKGALRAGIDLLLATAGVTASEVDRVLVAGSFGFHLREESLLRLGLLPPETAGKVSFLGNTAKSGAAMLLRNHDLRTVAAKLVEQVKVLELATTPAFDLAFTEALGFPQPSLQGKELFDA